MPRRSPVPSWLLVCALALAGCGSATVAELPPPATPPPSPPAVSTPAGRVLEGAAAAAARRDATGAGGGRATLADGRLLAVLDPRARTVSVRDARSGRRLATADAGVGPTRLACVGAGLCFVLDTRGDSLLVFRVAPDGERVRLTRRVHLAGGPAAIADDRARRRIWVALPGRNLLAELPAHGAPHVLALVPALRHARSVAVGRGGDVLVGGAGALQTYDPDDPDER